jgi:hypothetical protein
VKPPTLPAPTELVIVRPGSPETAGTRYLGLAEALDRLRGCQLRGKVKTRRWTLPEREAGLDAARARALLAAAENGFGWRPRERTKTVPARVVPSVPRTVTKPTFQSRLRFK